MIRPEDKQQLEAKGITEEQLEAQLEKFRTGFPFLKILQAARPEFGITVLGEQEEKAAIERWHKYLADGGEVTKFVPASGAASRMFKALFEFVDGADDIPAEGSPALVSGISLSINNNSIDTILNFSFNSLFAVTLSKVSGNDLSKL